MNFVIKTHALIKQWNQDLKLPQISDLDKSIQKISHPYSNKTYTNENTKLELCHLPFNDIQSCDIEIKNKNVTFIDETNIYSPLGIKNIIKKYTNEMIYKPFHLKILLQVQEITNYYNM